MKIRKATGLYFSPCSSTGKLAEALVRGLSEKLGCGYALTDVTTPKTRKRAIAFEADELLTVAFPTYAGRLPNKMLPWLSESIKCDGTPAVALTTFGNRNFDDSLKELALLLEASGAVPLGAAGICSRHAFSDDVGEGRPDTDDMEKLDIFTEQVASLIDNVCDIKDIGTFATGGGGLISRLPGNEPIGPYYTPLRADGEPARFLKAAPKTNKELCDSCGRCAEVCPMGSIDMYDFSSINGPCIKCQACVRGCHVGAKYFDDADFLSHVKMLKENYSRRAESRFFVL